MNEKGFTVEDVHKMLDDIRSERKKEKIFKDERIGYDEKAYEQDKEALEYLEKKDMQVINKNKLKELLEKNKMTKEEFEAEQKEFDVENGEIDNES
ncbi:hypothetical protein [Neobacillus cucumis]|uniref:hypothetical protein n=1 Tax=Neobacillus cucumis TaxID=1740721 RepID=UPI0019658FE6|nr:hypothetical protein [Neobacillus cucumis]MBM7656217.1 hypothetical protein [Neobacillus cucumis]